MRELSINEKLDKAGGNEGGEKWRDLRATLEVI